MNREESLQAIEDALRAIVKLDLLHDERRGKAVSKWTFLRSQHRRLWPEDTDDDD